MAQPGSHGGKVRPGASLSRHLESQFLLSPFLPSLSNLWVFVTSNEETPDQYIDNAESPKEGRKLTFVTDLLLNAVPFVMHSSFLNFFIEG